MTIKIPKPSIADKIRKLMGKKRGVILPSGEHEKLGPYTYSVAKKESFLKALLRPADEPLPNGMVDVHTFGEKGGRP
jgi:hypothetical protein